MKTIPMQTIRQEKLESFNQDCLDLFKDLSVDSLISQILFIAATWTNACYCICGLASSRRARFSTYQLFGFMRAGISGSPFAPAGMLGKASAHSLRTFVSVVRKTDRSRTARDWKIVRTAIVSFLVRANYQREQGTGSLPVQSRSRATVSVRKSGTPA